MLHMYLQKEREKNMTPPHLHSLIKKKIIIYKRRRVIRTSINIHKKKGKKKQTITYLNRKQVR